MDNMNKEQVKQPGYIDIESQDGIWDVDQMDSLDEFQEQDLTQEIVKTGGSQLTKVTLEQFLNGSFVDLDEVLEPFWRSNDKRILPSSQSDVEKYWYQRNNWNQFFRFHPPTEVDEIYFYLGLDELIRFSYNQFDITDMLRQGDEIQDISSATYKYYGRENILGGKCEVIIIKEEQVYWNTKLQNKLCSNTIEFEQMERFLVNEGLAWLSIGNDSDEEKGLTYEEMLLMTTQILDMPETHLMKPLSEILKAGEQNNLKGMSYLESLTSLFDWNFDSRQLLQQGIRKKRNLQTTLSSDLY